MRKGTIVLVACLGLMLGACSKSGPADGGQVATVMLKDGGSFTGTVTKSDTGGITLTATNGETRTYPMSQVDSVKYADSAAPAPDASASAKPSPASSMSSSPSPSKMTPAPMPEPVRTIPAGASIQVRNSDTIRAGVAQAGQKFPAVVVADVVGADGGLAIPKGSDAMLVVRESDDQGKIKGQSEIALDLDSVTVRGSRYTLETRDIVEKGTPGVGKNKRSAKFIGGGAALGAIIGAVAGGGKGAAIGAGAGAGGGVVAQAATRGKAISVPSESVLSFKLEEPVEIRLAH